ncbi:sigma-54-dependent transcriptional regulator [Candidatus Omnitrophota bacterium]
MKQQKRKYKIIICDDEENILQVVKGALSKKIYEVIATTNPKEMLEQLQIINPDVVVSDIRMPELSGIDVLYEVKKRAPTINVVLITAYASVDTAVEAIRGGAFDYLVKPFKINDLRAIIQRAVSEKKIDSVSDLDIKKRYKSIIGGSQRMQKVLKDIEKVAKSDCTVLISGESGTGKELVAQTIHYRSKRSKKPFVSINCAALPENLLESELFGYEKGAFTGAHARKIGLFEYAHNGTVFLDEIGDMSPSLQLKLLRVLQEHEIKRVGGVEDIPVDVCVLSATNKVLKAQVKAGKFREDLYYRLNVVPIDIPPLRDRIDDLQELLSYFIETVGERLGIMRKITFCSDAKKLLREYPWPGNVREVEHFIERLLVMCESDVIDKEVMLSIFGDDMFSPQSMKSTRGDQPISFESEKTSFEKDLIIRTLRKTNGNKYQAAKRLNLTRQNLQYKIKKYDIK